MSDLASMLRDEAEPDEVSEESADSEADPVEAGADADGEESSASGEDPEPLDEDEEGDDTPESGEDPAEGETDSADSGETEPGAEAGSELAALRAEVELVKQREAQLLELLGRQNEPQQQAPVAGAPDLGQVRELTSALKQVWSSEPGKDAEVLSRLSPQLRDAVQHSQRRHVEIQALLAADPAAFVEAVVLPALRPHLQEALTPIHRDRETAALRDFAARHADLSGNKETWQKVARLVVNENVPPEYAAQLVRQEVERAKVNQAKAQVDQRARQQRALSQSRKAQGTRKPTASGKPKPNFNGASSLGDFMEAERRAKRLADQGG